MRSGVTVISATQVLAPSATVTTGQGATQASHAEELTTSKAKVPPMTSSITGLCLSGDKNPPAERGGKHLQTIAGHVACCCHENTWEAGTEQARV